MQFMRFYRLLSLIAALSLISVLFFGFVIVPAAAQSDTMQFRYNAQHTGDYSPVVGNTQPNGQLRWNFTTGAWVYTTPVVANGIVYAGSDDGNFYAVNATTGVEVWRFHTIRTETVTVAFSSPAAAKGVVYFAYDNRT